MYSVKCDSKNICTDVALMFYLKRFCKVRVCKISPVFSASEMFAVKTVHFLKIHFTDADGNVLI